MLILKKILLGSLVLIATLLTPAIASAHVVVKPAQVAAADYQLFTTSVPNERDVPVTSIRLVVPDGVESVTPTTKPGWQIETIKSGDNIKEILWTDGAIESGYRDDFSFSAQAPAEPTTLIWKAYQTYADGMEVAWDQKPSAGGHEAEGENTGPYSTTKVVGEPTPSDSDGIESSSNATGAYALAGVALVLAIVAIARSVKHKS